MGQALLGKMEKEAFGEQGTAWAVMMAVPAGREGSAPVLDPAVSSCPGSSWVGRLPYFSHAPSPTSHLEDFCPLLNWKQVGPSSHGPSHRPWKMWGINQLIIVFELMS